MKTLLTTMIVFFSLLCELSGVELPKQKNKGKKVVTSTKRIYLPDYPGAHNPSIIKHNDNYLMIFRYIPNRLEFHWISYIGIVLLDESFEPVTSAQLLDTRNYNKGTPSQSEDARIVVCNGKYYVLYNDNMEITSPSTFERRDMYIAELMCEGNCFFLSKPLKLVHEYKYSQVLWQKNWSPFEWNGQMLLSYSVNPHEVLCPDLDDGVCQFLCETPKRLQWYFGRLRGGTPALKIDSENYLTFFHSGVYTTSSCSNDRDMWHYYMGACTFSAEPPFAINRISPAPIDAPSFYTFSACDKRIIYPGGFIVEGSTIYLSYGKDDSEVWIATIDLNNLMESMVPLYD